MPPMNNSDTRQEINYWLERLEYHNYEWRAQYKKAVSEVWGGLQG